MGLDADYLVACYGAFAVFVVYYLPWAVERVRTQRKGDCSFVRFGSRGVAVLEQGDVFLLRVVAYELLLQVVVGFVVEGKHHDARCVHVETMYNDGTCGVWKK